jgi:hypothetical protein
MNIKGKEFSVWGKEVDGEMDFYCIFLFGGLEILTQLEIIFYLRNILIINIHHSAICHLLRFTSILFRLLKIGSHF